MKRNPVVSGRFYPADKQELLETISECESSPLGVGSKTIEAGGKLVGLILPHAGYVFSGPVVTWGMRRLSLEKPLPERFLLLGPKHTHYGAKAAISAADSWTTPLGDVPINSALREALLATGRFQADDEAHAFEHSLEVEIPFLQKLYAKNPFSVTPIALQYCSFADCQKWGEAIGSCLADPRFSDVRVIVSSDFSHETPKEEAYKLDGQALEIIESLEPKEFYDLVISEERSICGVIPITVFLCALKGRKIRARCLKYSTSMDVMSHPRGVGYAAVSFELI